MHPELPPVIAGLLAALCGFGAGALGLGLVLHALRSGSRRASRTAVTVLVTAMAMAMGTVFAALGAFPYLVPVVLGALCLSSAVVSLAETWRLSDRLARGMLLALAALAAGATAATAFLHRTAP